MVPVEKILGNDVYKHPFFVESGILKQQWFRDKVSSLSKPNIWASLGQIFFEYFIISLVIAINVIFPNPWLYPLSVIIIGCRFHALFIIMHDGAHFRICKNKKLNEFLTHVLISFPLFANLKNWRRAHFAHHRDPNSDDDPDWVVKINNPDYTLPKKMHEFLKILVEHMFGIKMVKNIFSPCMTIKQKIAYFALSFKSAVMAAPPVDGSKIEYYSRKEKLILAAAYTLCLIAIFLLGWVKMFILFWILPMILWTHFVAKVRSYSEHFGLPNTSVYERTRTLYTTFIDKVFLGYTWNVGLHLDHHLFPGVPSYRLKKLHNIIKNIFPYSKYAHITRNGIFGVIKECTQ